MAEGGIVFSVHSTFRDELGNQVMPRGLQWGLSGKSHVLYVSLTSSLLLQGDDDRNSKEAYNENDGISNYKENDTKIIRQAVVEAHNRWAFAKQLPFKCEQDIVRVTQQGPHHLQVDWADSKTKKKPIMRTSLKDLTSTKTIQDLLEKESTSFIEAAGVDENKDSNSKTKPGSQVWINGTFVSTLEGPETLPPILEALHSTQSRRLCYRKQEDSAEKGNNYGDVIRIERMFRGGLRNHDDVFEHIMDTLLAMEDPEIIDENTLIGTATLPDWIMGGRLTSRIWVQDNIAGTPISLTQTQQAHFVDGSDDYSSDEEYSSKNKHSQRRQRERYIAFERPLYQDDISTSDRAFELHPNTADDILKIALVKHELKRLRCIAQLKHPFVVQQQEEQELNTLNEKNNKDKVALGTLQEEEKTSSLRSVISCWSFCSSLSPKTLSEKRRQQHRVNTKTIFGL